MRCAIVKACTLSNVIAVVNVRRRSCIDQRSPHSARTRLMWYCGGQTTWPFAESA